MSGLNHLEPEVRTDIAKRKVELQKLDKYVVGGIYRIGQIMSNPSLSYIIITDRSSQ